MDSLPEVARAILAIACGVGIALAVSLLAEWRARRKWERAAKRFPYITKE